MQVILSESEYNDLKEKAALLQTLQKSENERSLDIARALVAFSTRIGKFLELRPSITPSQRDTFIVDAYMEFITRTHLEITTADLEAIVKEQHL